jgi:hypothetical protein
MLVESQQLFHSHYLNQRLIHSHTLVQRLDPYKPHCYLLPSYAHALKHTPQYNTRNNNTNYILYTLVLPLPSAKNYLPHHYHEQIQSN